MVSEKINSNNFKVLVFSPDYPPQIGGIAAYSNGVARSLSIHCRVIVLAPRISGFRMFDQKQPYRTIRVVNLPGLREIIFLFMLIWLVSTKKINLIYNTVWFPCGIISLAVHFLFSTPYYIAAHASEVLDDEITLKRKIKKKFKKLKIFVLKKAQLNFPVSNYTKDRLIHMGVPPEKIIIIPDGVDYKRFHPDANSSWIRQRYGLEWKKVLLTVARLDRHKGHDFVLRALRSYVVEKFPNVVYLIVGDGPERKNLQKLTEDLDLNEKVIFVGLVEDNQIPAFYNCCDVFIMPSREIEGRTDLIEGFGVAYLEANACAKPVIGGRGGGTQDAIVDGQTGLLVDPTDIRALSEAICKLLSNKDYAALIGRQGRKRIEDFLNWEKSGEKLIHSMIKLNHTGISEKTKEQNTKLEYIVCNLCGIKRERALFHTEISDIVRCQICGLVYRNPRLVEKEELERYIYAGIVNGPPCEQINASKQKFFEDTLGKINRAMRPGRMLDVGCGDGFFLKLAQSSGWNVYGVEISKLLVEQTRERIETNKIFEGPLKEANFPLSFFSIVTFWDVLDHLSNPLATLQEVNRILKEDGVILIRMRNALFHVSFSVLVGKIASWLHLKPTVFHLYIFSPRTIRNMLEKAGFREIKVENSILTSGDPYRQGRIFGPLGINMIKRFMFAMFQVVYYLSGKRCVWASSIIVYGRK